MFLTFLIVFQSSSALYRESALFHIQSVIDRNSNDLDAALENLQESCAILEHMDTTFVSFLFLADIQADRIISCRFEEIMLLSEMGLEELAIEKGDLLFSQVYFDEDVWNFLVEQQSSLDILFIVVIRSTSQICPTLIGNVTVCILFAIFSTLIESLQYRC